MEKKKNLIVVCGPTASGKTRLAVELALRYHGEIVSADSRQVYRGMDIGTGKDLHEYSTMQGKLGYHLIDIVNPDVIFSLYDYKKYFEQVYKQLSGQNILPVLTGGTGLYIEAILKDYQIADVPEDSHLRANLMKEEKDSLVKKLAQYDYDLFSRTDCSSKKRIVRALEIALYKKNNPECRLSKKSSLGLNPLILCVTWERSKLRERIDMRLEQRLEQGLVDEVKKLLESGISEERFALFGMEYKHVARYIKKEVSYRTMVSDLKTSIHQLAKRQETWFRGMQRRGCEMHLVPMADLEIAVNIADSCFFGETEKTGSTAMNIG